MDDMVTFGPLARDGQKKCYILKYLSLAACVYCLLLLQQLAKNDMSLESSELAMA